MYWLKKAGISLGCALALLIGATPIAVAQEVRDEGMPFGYGAGVKRFQTAAEKQGRADWPLPNARPGTQARVTFDIHNADITLMTPHDFGKQRLLEEARRIAHALALPRTDFILIEGRKTVTVDMEFNKYLQQHGKRTDYTFDLSALSAALQASGLPRPIGIGVDTEEATRALLQTPTQERALQGYWFAAPAEIGPGTRLAFRAEPAWYAYPALLIFFSILLFTVLTPWLTLRARRRVSARTPAASTILPSPEEVQQKYDKAKPQWLMGLLPLLPAMLLLAANPAHVFKSIFMVMPFPMQYVMAGMMAAMLLSMGVARLVERHNARRNPTPPQTAETPEMETVRAMQVPLAMMMGIAVVMGFSVMLLMTFPASSPAAYQWRLYLMRGVLAACVLALLSLPFMARRAQRKLRTRLTEGPWHAMVQALAAQTGVTVRHLELVKSSTINAYASLWGTIGLTTALVEKMKPEEVRVVVAHEIGHLKCGHVKRSALLGLLCFGVMWGGWIGLRVWLTRRGVETAQFAALSPIVFMLGSNLLLAWVLGPGRRRREEEADRWALAWTGDAGLVIHTLTKMHTLNATPHRLKPSDEAFQTHPSLVHRVEALHKRVAAERELHE